MQLLDATAKNFLSFTDFSYNYSAQGLTNVDGNDDDLDVKTGAGKSTFLDVPCYAFFGKTSKNIKADEVINWDIKKDMELHFRFKREDGIYEIHRYRKHKTHENDFYIVNPSGDMIRGKDARETQKLLERLLGFDYEIFKKTIYFGQFDDTDKFLSSTDKEKKDLISTICDLSAYDEKLELVKAEMKEDNEHLKDIQQKRSILESSYDAVDRHLNSTGESLDRWNKQQKEKCDNLKQQILDADISLQQGIRNLEGKVAGWEEDKNKRLDEVESKIKTWNDVHGDKLHSLEQDSKKWIDKQESLIRTMSQDITKIEDDLKPAKEEYAKANAEEEIDYNPQIKEIEGKMNDLKLKQREGDKIYASKQHLEKLNEDLKKIVVKERLKKDEGMGSECPHCYQEITGDAIEKKIEGLYEEGKARKIEIDEHQAKIDQINTDMMVMEEYSASLKQITEDQNKQKMRAMSLRTLKDRVDGLARSLDTKKDDVERERERGNPMMLSIETAKGESNPHVSQKGFIEKEINHFIPELEAAKGKENPYPAMLEAANKDQNPHRKQLTELEKDLIDKTHSLEMYQLDVKKIEHQLQLGEFWKAGLGTYIRSMLMDSFLEQLNIQANDYLDTLFDGILKIQLASVTEGKKGVKEKIDQKIFNGNHECSYNSLSGGERRRICLAINLALSDITSKSLGTSFSLMMLDEIFTGLDNQGKVQTMKLLKELEPRFETILVIDHTEEFKSLFTNVITVRKKGGISTIV